MIPVVAPHSPQPAYGEIGPEEVLDLVDAIRAVGPNAVVTATAKGYLYAAGPLLLDLKVTRA